MDVEKFGHLGEIIIGPALLQNPENTTQSRIKHFSFQEFYAWIYLYNVTPPATLQRSTNAAEPNQHCRAQLALQMQSPTNTPQIRKERSLPNSNITFRQNNFFIRATFYLPSPSEEGI